MKGFFIAALAVVGGYTAWQWFTHRKGSLSRGFSVSAQVGPLSASAGIGDYVVSPLASGVPTFNSAPIANGHGDQVAAAYHSNPMATVSGTSTYTPAFGPQANQPTSDETEGGSMLFGY